MGLQCQKRNVNYNETEKQKIKLHNLREHECVLVHCEREFQRVTCIVGCCLVTHPISHATMAVWKKSIRDFKAALEKVTAHDLNHRSRAASMGV